MKRIKNPRINSMLLFLQIAFLALLLTQCANQVPADSALLSAIADGDSHRLDKYLKQGTDINRLIGEDEISPLSYSIKKDQLTAAYLLLENGANTEIISEGKTPLMYASRYGRPEIAKLLISCGAELNKRNNDGNTAFHYASKYSNHEMLELLYEAGAEINAKNNELWTALDFTVINNKPELADYLKSIGVKRFPKNLPDTFDGPFVNILSKNKISVNYLAHDNHSNETTVVSSLLDVEGNNSHFEGSGDDNSVYTINLRPEIPPAIYDQPDRILAIGDIHGQYLRMIDMLRGAGVIDDSNNWIWDDDHLLFIGDIFDRGEGVTEALWYIYNLEQQARESGGRVHLLLGNHEMMILKNDIRYIANKYYCLTSNLNIDYTDLYGNETVIGSWLRSKNAVEKIGNTLFVHAGISPDVARLDIPLESINSIMRDFLTDPADTTNAALKTLVTGTMGPLWYRGYLRSSGNYDKIDQTELEEILVQYSSDVAVVGHTEIDSVGITNQGKTIHINIPLAKTEIPGQALLIENGHYYRITLDNERTLLK